MRMGDPDDVVIILAGYNGMPAAQAWMTHLNQDAGQNGARVFSWRESGKVDDFIAATAPIRLTLIGHSLGAGQAQLVAQRLPVGMICNLITVAPFAPPDLDTGLVRKNVGYWLNIVAAPRWHDPFLRFAGRVFLNWQDQGAIARATENHFSRFPHQDFYRLICERCGDPQKGKANWLSALERSIGAI
jgi:pimeloyl-ACP methyl ester carboxylesterase